MAHLAAPLAAYKAAAARPSFSLVALLEAHEALTAVLLADGRPEVHTARTCLAPLGPALDRARRELPRGIDLAVYLRAAAELQMLSANLGAAHSLLTEAAGMFEEGGAKCADEVQACQRMLAVCVKRLAAQGLSPPPPPVLPPQQQQQQPVLRPLVAADRAAAERLARAAGEKLALPPAGRELEAYLKANADLCLVATVAGGVILGVAVAITDGSFGYLRQLLIAEACNQTPTAPTASVASTPEAELAEWKKSWSRRNRECLNACCAVDGKTLSAMLRKQIKAALAARGAFGSHLVGARALEEETRTHLVYAL